MVLNWKTRTAIQWRESLSKRHQTSLISFYDLDTGLEGRKGKGHPFRNKYKWNHMFLTDVLQYKYSAHTIVHREKSPKSLWEMKGCWVTGRLSVWLPSQLWGAFTRAHTAFPLSPQPAKSISSSAQSSPRMTPWWPRATMRLSACMRSTAQPPAAMLVRSERDTFYP